MEVAQRNQALQMPASIKLPVGDNQRFELAIKAKKIKDLSEQELSEVLRYVMVKIGLREQNWPHPTEKILLINHIVENFGGNTGNEIKLAFEMAIAGKLDAEVNCYENFSCLYFSTIMNAYRKWAVEEYKLIKPEVKELPAPIDEPMTDDEIIEMNYDVWKVLKNYQAISASCFDILMKQEKIKRVEGEEREFVIKKATTDLHEELRETGEVLSFEKKEKRIQALCKKLVVQKYFLE